MKGTPPEHLREEGITLVLGGTGQTGRRVAERLQARGVRTRVASRSARPVFDWNAPDTWDANLDGVTAAYITYAPDLAIPGAADSIRQFVEEEIARSLNSLFETVLDGRNAYVGDGVQRALGRAPTDFSDYARRIAARGTWNVPGNEVAA